MAFSSQIMFRPWNLKAKSNQSASTAKRVFEDPKNKIYWNLRCLKSLGLETEVFLWHFLMASALKACSMVGRWLFCNVLNIKFDF